MAKPDGGPSVALRGYLILAGLLLAGLLIFNLHVIIAMLRPTIDVVALIEEAPGIRVGSSAWVEGVESGRVTDVEVVWHGDSTLVAIGLRLDARSSDLVTTGSDVRAARQRVIGDPIVRIRAGSPGERPVRDGDTLRGKHRLAAADLLARGQALPAAIDSLREAALEIQSLVQRRAPELERLAADVDATLTAASSLLDQLDGATVAAMFDPGHGLHARIQALGLRLDQLQRTTAGALARHVTDPGAPLPAGMESLDRRARDLTAAVADLEGRLEEGRGILLRAQEDTAIQVAVRSVQAQVDSLTAEALSVVWRMFVP